MAEKVNIKLKHSQLQALGGFLQYAITQLDEDSDWHKLLGFTLMGIMKKKLVTAIAFPKPETRMSFKQEEALAIMIASEIVDLLELDSYTAAVMIDLSNQLK